MKDVWNSTFLLNGSKYILKDSKQDKSVIFYVNNENKALPIVAVSGKLREQICSTLFGGGLGLLYIIISCHVCNKN